MNDAPNEGEKADEQANFKVLNESCPKCLKQPIHLLDTICVEGSLENYHLVHTEVELHFSCPNCNYKWHKWEIW